MDDMLAKSLKAIEHINNLKDFFEILRKYKMMLNPAKCAVTSGKFLGFMVNYRGIEANPTKIQDTSSSGHGVTSQSQRSSKLD